jgi:hypothetical protein
MIVERHKDEVIVRLPANVDLRELQDTLDYLRYREATAGSKAKQSDVDALAEEVNRSMAERLRKLRGH